MTNPDTIPTEPLIAPDFTWFNNARFGIFVHWGIYSVGQYEASWAFFNHGVPGQNPKDSLPLDQYMAQRHAFLARRFDPVAWCELFKAAGARYTILGTKHHDGVALWDTTEGLSTVRDCTVGKDLVAPFVDAARAAGLHLGLYYSHIDWNHPDYATVRQPKEVTHVAIDSPSYRYAYPEGPDEPERWEKFLRFHRMQLKELCERFLPDLLWFDGQWERSAEQWKFAELRKQLLEWRPGVILNGRMGGYGDCDTPEQGIPTIAPKCVWELCLTMNKSWSMALDPSYKTTQELVRVLCECAGMGGNLLLNVSPLSDCTIFYEQERLLREIGAWRRCMATPSTAPMPDCRSRISTVRAPSPPIEPRSTSSWWTGPRAKSRSKASATKSNASRLSATKANSGTASAAVPRLPTSPAFSGSASRPKPATPSAAS